MTKRIANRCPVLPLRDIVVFPHMVVPLFVGREKSIRALELVMNENTPILLVAQKDSSDDDPDPSGIYSIGVLASVVQLLKLPDGTVKVIVEGKERVRILDYVREEDFYEVEVEPFPDIESDGGFSKPLFKAVIKAFGTYAKASKQVSDDALSAVSDETAPSTLADIVASHLAIPLDKKQELLETVDLGERLEAIWVHLESELSVLRVEKKIKRRVKTQMERTQKEYYLNEQMKAIQKELGDGEGSVDEAGEIEERISKTKLSKEARERAEGELKKFRQMPPMSAEATVVRNYLEWILSIPWGKKSRVRKDLNGAQEVLDADHYGLEKVKERIVEYLAVQQRSTKLRGPILCLVGPPGVGKTSLGKSVARATGREFIRISLGGVRDEAEIRGHRRTYIGSMPGKIIYSMKKGKTVNPLILLDEIDKMGRDFRGDPASAMLEVLDPEQNSTFTDHYLEFEYDLSNVMFLTTANTYNMPDPLLDRMETIALPGYTEDEKLEIARRHLFPKQLSRHGLKEHEFGMSDDALVQIIRTYTREAGVRNLEREIAKLARKSVTEIVRGNSESVSVDLDNLEDFLGVRRFKYGLAEEQDQVGVATGLAWTQAGGDLLSIEALKMPGKGQMKTTGKLGDVMKESIDAASSLVRSMSPGIGVKPTQFARMDIHVHVPEGATPKDGPSAGIAMVTAIVSVLTGIPVYKNVAMTGEITLRGNVLPIGGLKEKLLAALRGGISTVVIPKDNEKDLREIDEGVVKNLTIVPVVSVEDVLKLALVRQPEPVEWDDSEFEAEFAAIAARTDGDISTATH